MSEYARRVTRLQKSCYKRLCCTSTNLADASRILLFDLRLCQIGSRKHQITECGLNIKMRRLPGDAGLKPMRKELGGPFQVDALASRRSLEHRQALHHGSLNRRPAPMLRLHPVNRYEIRGPRKVRRTGGWHRRVRHPHLQCGDDCDDDCTAASQAQRTKRQSRNDATLLETRSFVVRNVHGQRPG